LTQVHWSNLILHYLDILKLIFLKIWKRKNYANTGWILQLDWHGMNHNLIQTVHQHIIIKYIYSIYRPAGIVEQITYVQFITNSSAAFGSRKWQKYTTHDQHFIHKYMISFQFWLQAFIISINILHLPPNHHHWIENNWVMSFGISF